MGNTRKLTIVKRTNTESSSTQSLRKILAIVFTDVAGFSSMMAKDEESTLKLMALNKVIQKSIVSKYKGKWIKELGDGYLSTFENASDAVRCARQIVEKTSDESALLIKVGIHLAEVIVNENDIMGDGVNIAARIVDDTPGGEIQVSESIFNNLRNKPDLHFTRIAERWFKNIDRPITVYRFGESSKVELTADDSSSVKSKIAIGTIECTTLLDNERNYIIGVLSGNLIQSAQVELSSPSLAQSLGTDLIKNASSLKIDYLLEGNLASHNNELLLNLYLSDIQSKSVISHKSFKLTQNEDFEPLAEKWIQSIRKFF